jgi:hypothetical protein
MRLVRLGLCAAIAAVLASGAGRADARSGFTADLQRTLKKIDRDLCRSVESLKCTRKAPASKTVSPKAKAKPSKVKQEMPAVTKAAPIPREKPSRAVDSDAAEVPKPRIRPRMPGTTVAQAPPPIPKEKPVLRQSEPKTEVTVLLPSAPAPKIVVLPPSPPSVDECRDALKALGMSFETPPTLVDAGRCSVADPVKLDSFRAGSESIAFPDGPVLNCNFALRFGTWLKDEGAPVARRTTRSALDKFYTGPGYQCRGRNGDGSAKISEHGYGNAVDITFFKLKDGRTFQVKDALNPMSPAYQTLAEFRSSGCKYFSTVLGPGTNAAHAEHFHFDLGKHGKSGTYMICE